MEQAKRLRSAQGLETVVVHSHCRCSLRFAVPGVLQLPVALGHLPFSLSYIVPFFAT